MPQLLFVFLDGVGLGPATDANPFATAQWPALQALAGDQPWTDALAPLATPERTVRAIDATLGVDGLPQSGTGQASLFTGVNGPARAGRHYGPFPHSATFEALRTQNLFQRIRALDDPRGPAFANAYPPQFFERVDQTGRWTVTTRCCVEAGVEIRGVDAARDGRAVPADLSGDAWRTHLGIDLGPLSPTRAGEHLLRVHRAHAVTVFEYFLTDKVGHRRVDTTPDVLLHQLDAFFGALLDGLDPAEDTLLVSSDHGNLEDRSHTQHTRHPVPLFAYGWAAPFFADARALTDVTPAVERALRAASTSRDDLASSSHAARR